MFAFPNDKDFIAGLPALQWYNPTSFCYDWTAKNQYPKRVGKLMKKVKSSPADWGVIALCEKKNYDVGRMAKAVADTGTIPGTIRHVAVIHTTKRGATISDVWRMSAELIDAGATLLYDGAWVEEHMGTAPLFPQNYFANDNGRLVYVGPNVTDAIRKRFEDSVFPSVAEAFEPVFGTRLREEGQLSAVISALGFGLVECPESLSRPPSGKAFASFTVDILGGAFSDIVPPYALAEDLGRLWQAFMKSLPAIVSPRNAGNETLEFLAGMGEMCGMKAMVEALASGVPVEDCAVGLAAPLPASTLGDRCKLRPA